MNRDDIKASVNEIFCDVLDNPALVTSENMTAEDIDNWDSLAHISIITAIEKTFKIRFTISEIDSVQSVGDIITAVEKRLA